MHKLVHDYNYDEHDMVKRGAGDRYSGTGKKETGVTLDVRAEPQEQEGEPEEEEEVETDEPHFWSISTLLTLYMSICMEGHEWLPRGEA